LNKNKKRKNDMKGYFILFGCLLTATLLQAEPLSNGCCSGNQSHEHQLTQSVLFAGGCGCGGGRGNSSNEIPPDNS